MSGNRVINIDLTEEEANTLLNETRWWTTCDPPMWWETTKVMRDIYYRIENELEEEVLDA